MKRIQTVQFLLAAALAASAGTSDRDALTFSVTTNTGFGLNVHVVGSHPDTGAWNPVDSVKLRWTPGNVWTGRVAVQKNTALEYKFIVRSLATNLYCDGNNTAWEPGANRTAATAAWPDAPYAGKTIYYYSAWTSASILVIGPTNTAHAMTPAGPGRTPGEFLYKAEGVGATGEWIEFVPNGYSGGTLFWDNPPWPETNQNYVTRLDAFVLQDGQIYNYWPAPSVSAPRKEDRYIDSTFAPVSGRTARIILPRGYDSHPWKRYPVVYFTDGQNITNGANVFGNGSWEADLTAQREAAAGRMREVILVGVDNYPERRRWEYNPPGDIYPGEPPGRADAYLAFLVHNVRPTIDFHYRTLNDRRNTFAAGSSMGGIFSIYAGFETNVFGGIIAMSPAFTRAGVYTTSLYSRAKAPIRIYLDTGSAEGQVGITPGGNYWDAPWEGYDIFLAQGFTPNEDLLMRIGCGHQHNEAAWRARLPVAYHFLLDARDEPNRIALAEWPAVLNGDTAAGTAAFATAAHGRYQVETSTDATTWNPHGPAFVETNAWNTAVTVVTSAVPVRLLRVSATPRE